MIALILSLWNIYLFLPLHRYERSTVKALPGDRKFYSIDNGLRRTLIHTGSEDKGSLLENNMYLFLRSQLKMSHNLHYYNGRSRECDFVLTDREETVALIQVSLRVDDPATYRRETTGLIEASEALHCDTLYLVTEDTEKTVLEAGKEIRVVPAWKFALNFSLDSHFL
jgi:Predicted ATPase (AAA+ superfamily)